jgi:hypothetical protein
LSWVGGGVDVVAYNIYRDTSPITVPQPDQMLDFGITDTSYQDSGLDPSTTYYYLVTAVNSAGDESNPSNAASATTSAATITASGQDLTGDAGQDLEGTVASFTDTDPNADEADFTATVNWPGGGSSDGTVSFNDSGGFDVTADNVFQNAGDQNYTVTITNSTEGQTATTTGTAHVADAPFDVEAGTVTVGAFAHWITAVISSDNPYAKASDFTATVDWGDGSGQGNADVSVLGSEFQAVGTHTYPHDGEFFTTVTVTDSHGQTVTSNGHVLIQQFSTGYTLNGYLDSLFVSSQGNLFLGSIGLGTANSGWGVADANSGLTGNTVTSGLKDVSLELKSNQIFSTIDLGSALEVDEIYAMTSSPGVFQDSVTIKNISQDDVDLLYRRYALYNSYFVGFQGSSSPLAYDSNDTSASLDPLSSTTGSNPPSPMVSGDFDDVASYKTTYPNGQQYAPTYVPYGGTLMNFDFGDLSPNADQTFTFYFATVSTRAAAVGGMTANGAEAYSLGLPATYPPPNYSPAADDKITTAVGFKSGEQYSEDMSDDANNDGTINATDDPIKDNPSDPGKIVIADNLDEDNTNIPGYADFSNNQGKSFAPLDLTRSDNVDLSQAEITFSYSSADPILVKSTSVPGSDLKQYNPGSTGYLRIWAHNLGRNPASIVANTNPGDFIPDGAAIPASSLFTIGLHTTTLYVEGVNPSDPNIASVSIDIDEDGTGAHVLHDTVDFTVASVKLVYTDVSGLSHDSGSGPALNVNRIPNNVEPDGVACDWLHGVDDGSLLLVRITGSQSLANLLDSDAGLSFQFGELGMATPDSPLTFGNLDSNDGYVHTLDDGFVSDPQTKLDALGIEHVGQSMTTLGPAGMTVLGEAFYRPPDEFDLDQGAADTNIQRRVPLYVQLYSDGHEIGEGSKPQGVMLTRPPLVLVHGIAIAARTFGSHRAKAIQGSSMP